MEPGLGAQLRGHANWKLFVENANDGYHIEFVHDVLTDLLVFGSGETTLEPHGAYSMADVNPAYVPPELGRARIRFGSVFPNLVPVLTPGDLTYIRVTRSRSTACGSSSARTTISRTDRRCASSAARRSCAPPSRTSRWCSGVQRGLQAHGLPAGVHSSQLEARIAHFERLWAEALRQDAPAGPGAALAEVG